MMALCSLSTCDRDNADFIKNAKLVMAIDMVRHGDRGPNNWIPSVMKGIWKKEEVKQLTNKGAQESKEVGYKFNRYYIDNLKFLSPIASPKEVYVRSTDFQRTKDTAKAILEGMFSDSASNIRIDFKEYKNDSCNGFSKNKEAEEKINKCLINNMPQSFKKELISGVTFINKQYQTSYPYPYGLSKFGDFLYVSKIHNKPLPHDMTRAEADKLIGLTKKRFLYVWAVPARNCYHSLDLIKEIESFFESKINNTTNFKYVLLTMHDMNIVPLLLFLNYPITQKPRYNADVRFELLKANGKFYVRTTFDQEVVRVCKRGVCGFDEFKNVIQESIQTKCNDFNINYEYLKGFLS